MIFLMMRLNVVLTLFFLLFSTASSSEISLAASSNLSVVLPKVITLFENKTGHVINLSLGSSRTIAHQIRRGAPYDLFLSADKASIARIRKPGASVLKSTIYALGKLCLFLPKSSDLALAADLSGLKVALYEGELLKLAIANPEIAPYGELAVQALKTSHLLDGFKDVLVYGENAAQTAFFAATNSVDAALLPCSLAQFSELRGRGRSVEVLGKFYTKVAQAMVILNKDSPIVRAFFDFMQTTAVKKLFLANGYSLP